MMPHKLLSENPEAYKDAAIQGIKDLMDVPSEADIPVSKSALSRWARLSQRMPY